MISVDQALKHVACSAKPLAARDVSLDKALGARLAEPIVSEVDSPPFDKSMLDGYAVVADDRSPIRRILEQVIAGGVPHHAVEPGTTISVMTGAPVPDGANAVIKHEEVKCLDDSTIELPDSPVAPGAGLMPRGAAFGAGQEVLNAGRRLSPIDIALLAEVGKASVSVVPRPRVAVLATGNELVEPGQRVGPGQIFNSNGPMLLALLKSRNVRAINLGIGRDDPDALRELIDHGLDADVLLITGGVSAGVMDLVPGLLDRMGVDEVFHKVKMKPGKPLWFGERNQEDRRTLVFGLPGNPVSTLVSFAIFVQPALEALAGNGFAATTSLRGVLTDRINHRGSRPTYYPCWIDFGRREEGKPCVEPLPWRGSADLAALTRANALAILPAGDYELGCGDGVEVLVL